MAGASLPTLAPAEPIRLTVPAVPVPPRWRSPMRRDIRRSWLTLLEAVRMLARLEPVPYDCAVHALIRRPASHRLLIAEECQNYRDGIEDGLHVLNILPREQQHFLQIAITQGTPERTEITLTPIVGTGGEECVDVVAAQT